jgi:hypothetical protein
MVDLGIRSWLVLVVCASALGLAPPGQASASEVAVGGPTLVNLNSSDEVTDRPAYFSSMNRTGRYVVFETSATNMHGSAVTYGGLYLRDRRTGQTLIPVRDRRGRPPARGAVTGALSPSGRYLAYCSTDPQIVRPDSYDEYTVEPPGEHPDTDVFVRDLRTGETRRLSTAWNGKESDEASCQPKVADNGDAVFGSSASDLVRHDGNGPGYDVYLYDWSAKRLHRLPEFFGGWVHVTISGDGRFVVGLSPKGLVRADRNHLADVYVLHRRRDGSPGRHELVSQRAGGGGLQLGCDAGPVDVSHDGRYVVGSCRDGDLFDPPIPDKSSHLALFDRRSGRHTLLNPTSVDPSGVRTAAVSDDGRTVLYGSSSSGYGGTPLETGPDVYVWRRGAGITLISAGDDVAYRWWGSFVDLTGDGRLGLFESDSELAPDATPGFFDSNAYTVRLGE